MLQKIESILKKHGIELDFAPELAGDLEFAFTIYGPGTNTEANDLMVKKLNDQKKEIDNLKKVIKLKTTDIENLGSKLKAQYKLKEGDDTTTIAEAKDMIFNSPLFELGVNCHCCNQRVQLYYRNINGSQANELLLLYRKTKQQPDKVYFHVNEDLHRQASATGIDKLRHWGLIEERNAGNDDAHGKRSGYWKITAKGEAFCEGRERVPKYAKIFHATCYGLDDSAGTVSIHDCLGKKFDYKELMERMV